MESELVSGFMTEHSAAIFVKFFLAEYASIVTICILTSILFLGGYLFVLPTTLLFDILNNILGIEPSVLENIYSYISSSPFNLAWKTAFFAFTFIWVRASFPRIRFDQLMAFCWTVLLPVVFAIIILIPCVLYSFNSLPTNVSLF